MVCECTRINKMGLKDVTTGQIWLESYQLLTSNVPFLLGCRYGENCNLYIARSHVVLCRLAAIRQVT